MSRPFHDAGIDALGWVRNTEEKGYTRYAGGVLYDRLLGLLIADLGPRIGLVSSNGRPVGEKGRWWAAVNTGDGPDHVRRGFRSHRAAMRWADCVVARHTRLGAEGCPCGECAGYHALVRMFEGKAASEKRWRERFGRGTP
jgi:hypothetical protein